jgi:outer membrane protein assembly factor BamA
MCRKAKWILLWCCLSIDLLGQQPKVVHIASDVQDSVIMNQAVPFFRQGFTDKVLLHKAIHHWVDSMQGLGYLECHAGDITENDSGYIFSLFAGKKYRYEGFDYSQVPYAYVQRSGFERIILNKKTLSYAECKMAMRRIANYMDETGYPFAQVYLDSATIGDGFIKPKLNVLQGPRVYIDTIEWDGRLKVSPDLMQKVIGLRTGMLFSNHAMMDLENRIGSIKFLEQIAVPTVTLYKNKALIHLYLKDKKVSSLDALLGLLPGTDSNPGLKINGTFNGHFINALRQGESLLINFQSLQNSSQSLTMDLSIPYLLKLPFSPFARFNLYKRDSLFLDVKSEVGAAWTLGKHGSFKALLGSLASSLLKPDLALIRSTRTLPPALDISSNYLGGSIEYEKLDVELNPRSGISIKAFINGSSRSIRTNPSIIALKDERDTAYSFSGLYTALLKKGYAVEWGLQFSKFIPTGRFTTWYSHIQWASKNASSGLQLNELYRIGGYQLMRGFDEQSILAKDYLLWVNEIRLITGALSYIHIHNDLGSIRALNKATYQQKIYWSFGGGMVFNTSLGLLSVSTSVGRKLPDGFDFRAVKLHVGYVSYF